MVDEPIFLPIETISCVDGATVEAGSLIYLPMRSLRHYALIGAGEDDSRYLYDFGTDRSFGVWVNEQNTGPAILVSAWRLEVDPTSAVADRYASLLLGHAYTDGGGAGLVGMIQPHQRTKVTMSTAGAVATGGRFDEHRAFYSRWRIVVGPADKPVVLVDSRSLPVPAADE